MKISISSIEVVNFRAKYAKITADIQGSIPYFHLHGEEILQQNSPKLVIEACLHQVSFLSNDRKDLAYNFYPSWGSNSQEYFMSFFENLEKVSTDSNIGIFLPIKEAYDEADNNDTLGYVIGEIVKEKIAINPYYDEKYPIRSYFYPDVPILMYKLNCYFLKVGDLKIQLWGDNFSIGDKYKCSCTIFTKYGQYPQYDGFLAIDGLITREDISIDELKSHGIKEY